MDQLALDAMKQLNTRTPEEYKLITVRPITPIIGAEVSDVDLSRDLDADRLDEVRRAFLAHHVLVFRDQTLTPEDHKRFAAHFGTLRTQPIDEGGDPVILELSSDSDSKFVAGDGWHCDGTADAEPSLGSMLYITRTPESGSGGDTMWANMHLAYEMLSPPMRDFLDGLTAVHDGLVPWQGYQPPDDYVVPKSEHPVVVRHPDTGRKLLFVNEGFTTHIAGLSKAESRALLDLLFGLVRTEPYLACRVRWTPGTLVFWDNRCTQHHAIWDYFPQSRYGQRITINGTRPRG
ncbi:taurine dioxygenase [Krasilnikovia cinnamomea]|uniref:Taurine dioxygenase n=1 Tax=Krasilnikovia cinnamomea TaxID=349313 RepID=A0A4Q7ZQE3_9ACTN|nr:TauD/TfdA family dioxygenase [Krasilnikovia cinnamomea]RZU53342.1 taurine dioxygenase [Krasilnikovia cinnamomea]